MSCRKSALRAGSRAGHAAGTLARRAGVARVTADYARKLAAGHAVPAHWRPVFERAFVRAAVAAARAHVDQYVAKYGVA